MSHSRSLGGCGSDSPALVGGKALGLGRLASAGFEVPAGFVLTTGAYRAFVDANPSLGGIADSFADAVDSEELRRRSGEARARFETCRVPETLEAEIAERYRELGAGGRLPVAVRSSATAEDTGDASFAGQQETYLGIVGEEAVRQSVIRCWASLFTPQAVTYRRNRGIDAADLAMAVVVQTMVPAAAAGVMLTIDPVTGDRSQISIEASFGLGAAVVNGEVTPDRFAVDKVLLELRSSTIADKSVAYRMDPATGLVTRETVEAAARAQPSLSDAEVLELAAVGKRVEAAFGGAQDVEWAVVPTASGARQIVLLQARPETVWSRRRKSEQATSASVLERVIRNMTMPLPGSRS